MGLRILIFLLVAAGGLLVSGMSLPRISIRSRIQEAAVRVTQVRSKKAESAKEYVARINGKAKEGFLARSRREAREVYEQTGQTDRFGKTLKLSLATGALGAISGLAFWNPLLSIVLAVGFYYLPLWLTQFSLYRYNRFLNDELETALSLITTSYTRSNDILAAVEENLAHINEPVKTVFVTFCNNLKYVDPNAPAQIERMKSALDNKIFWQWCDSLILCQSDHTQRATLIPIVNKYSDQKAQQQENETKMMMPLRQAIMMILIVLSVIPLLRLANIEWYTQLVATLFGQVALVATAVGVLMTINKAIRLSKPIEYDV